MPNTMTLISAVTVGSGGAASIDFTSIPSTYTDLVLKCTTRNSTGAVGLWIRLNNDSGANYTWRMLYGDGSSAASFSQTVGADYNKSFFAYANPSTYTANTFGSTEILMPNYAGSTNKSVSIDSVGENNSTQSYASFTAGLWSNTSAITSITILPEGGTANLVQYSTAYLYGISKS